MELGNRLRQYRFEHDQITQQDLANAVGVTRVTIHSVETGKFVPSTLLALKLARFPDVVLMATEQYKPNAIADYLYELAQCYSTFYQTVPFLKAEEGPRESRVRLCGIVARVLRQGLDLLGIEAPTRI